MNRAQRRRNTASKFAKRAKLWYRIGYQRSDFSSWVEMVSKERWAKKLRHGKVYGRSKMSNMEKHRKIKSVRKESRRICADSILCKAC